MLSGNPGVNTAPGLLVEKTITSRNIFDFFLQSHYGAIGTVSPTHYSVLRDDWKPSPCFWQTVVFAQSSRQCSLYEAPLHPRPSP
ncbi:hypothetical protein PENTCL1PPCAC_29186, partial [Pristionchus entomophagus]